jgi:hypothetical protein
MQSFKHVHLPDDFLQQNCHGEFWPGWPCVAEAMQGREQRMLNNSKTKVI